MDFDKIIELLPLLIPLFLIQVSFQVIAIINLVKKQPQAVRFENKAIWFAIIILGAIVGTAAYFIFGGQPYVDDSSEDY